MWEKIEELFPFIIKIIQIGCDFSHIQISEDLSIKMKGDGKGLTESAQGIFGEKCDIVILTVTISNCCICKATFTRQYDYAF